MAHTHIRHRVTHKSAIAALALGLSLGLVSTAHALPAEATAPEARTIVKTQTLLPADGSGLRNGRDKDGASMRLTKYSDGSIEVTGNRLMAADAPGTEYSYDLKKGTYKAMPAKPDETAPPAEGTATPDGGVAIAAAAGRRIHLQVRDPAGIVVAQNFNELWWNFDFNKVWPNALAEWCNASNPSAAGTRWFTMRCNDGRGAWLWNANTRITNQNKGLYENWDFMNPGLGTWAEIVHNTITGHQNGVAELSWHFRAWGEWSGALSAKMV